MSTEFTKEIEKLALRSHGITENTELYNYIKQINNQMDTNGMKSFDIKKYCSDRVEDINENRPFLSVVLRTQGKRLWGLKESLLSLRGQTNTDFEVVLIAHKADDEGKNNVKSIIKAQPKSFQKKIRYIELDEGTRTAPINCGCANAKGEYIAIYDDDDILFDNWVETFHKEAQISKGKVLHAYVLAQKWKETVNGYVSISAPTPEYCVDFSLLSQLIVNKCPLMGMAFPAYLFNELGFSFNEDLDVTEDWEFMMRVIPITGVADINIPTSIYRFWVNAESSYTIHNNDVWTKTYNNIHKQMNERLLLVPKNYTKDIIYLINEEYKKSQGFSSGFPKIQGILFWGSDRHFSDEKLVRANNQAESPKFKMEFLLPDVNAPKYFRFDPCEYGGFILSKLKIMMETDTGEVININESVCRGNGLKTEMGVYYLHYDPQIIWRNLYEKVIVKITVEGETSIEIPEDIIAKAIKREYGFGRVSESIRKLIMVLKEKLR